MSDFDVEDLTDTEDEGAPTEGSRLRRALEDALKERKKLQKQLEELQARINEETANKVFQRYKVPDKVRKIYKGEMTEEAITEWLREYADVFKGIELEEPQETEAPEPTPEIQQGLRQVQDATRAGSNALPSADGMFGEIRREIERGGFDPAAVQEKIMDALRAAQARGG